MNAADVKIECVDVPTLADFAGSPSHEVCDPQKQIRSHHCCDTLEDVGRRHEVHQRFRAEVLVPALKKTQLPLLLAGIRPFLSPIESNRSGLDPLLEPIQPIVLEGLEHRVLDLKRPE